MTSKQMVAIEEAIQLVEEAQGLVDDALSMDPKEDNYRAYGRYGFDQLLGNGNKYDSSLHSLLEGDEDDKDDEWPE